MSTRRLLFQWANIIEIQLWVSHQNVSHSHHDIAEKSVIAKELDDPQAFADTPIGQSLLKLDESQRKRLESLFNTAYSVVKAGKPFSDYELICEIQVKNGLGWKLLKY